MVYDWAGTRTRRQRFWRISAIVLIIAMAIGAPMIVFAHRL